MRRAHSTASGICKRLGSCATTLSEESMLGEVAQLLVDAFADTSAIAITFVLCMERFLGSAWVKIRLRLWGTLMGCAVGLGIASVLVAANSDAGAKLALALLLPVWVMLCRLLLDKAGGVNYLFAVAGFTAPLVVLGSWDWDHRHASSFMVKAGNRSLSILMGLLISVGTSLVLPVHAGDQLPSAFTSILATLRALMDDALTAEATTVDSRREELQAKALNMAFEVHKPNSLVGPSAFELYLSRPHRPPVARFKAVLKAMVRLCSVCVALIDVCLEAESCLLSSRAVRAIAAHQQAAHTSAAALVSASLRWYTPPAWYDAMRGHIKYSREEKRATATSDAFHNVAATLARATVSAWALLAWALDEIDRRARNEEGTAGGTRGGAGLLRSVVLSHEQHGGAEHAPLAPTDERLSTSGTGVGFETVRCSRASELPQDVDLIEAIQLGRSVGRVTEALRALALAALSEHEVATLEEQVDAAFEVELARHVKGVVSSVTEEETVLSFEFVGEMLPRAARGSEVRFTRHALRGSVAEISKEITRDRTPVRSPRYSSEQRSRACGKSQLLDAQFPVRFAHD